MKWLKRILSLVFVVGFWCWICILTYKKPVYEVIHDSAPIPSPTREIYRYDWTAHQYIYRDQIPHTTMRELELLPRKRDKLHEAIQEELENYVLDNEDEIRDLLDNQD
jgi:hypothetical protein